MNQPIGDRIQSLRDSVNASYVKPDPNKNEELRQNLKNTPHALEYIKNIRGLNSDTIDYFKLGYDIEKDAISIPEFKNGELVNIRYRVINPGDKSKYLQEKGAEVWLFHEEGIGKGQAKGGVLIVEGEIDCMSAWQAGFKNVISPASGKDSFGVWIDLLDSIPKVYIAYDNDKPGKQASKSIAERVGIDKCFEVVYPEGIKDANEFFQKYDAEAYKNLIRDARPFYKYKYQGVRDVIDSLREKVDNVLKVNCIPFVEFEEDYLVVLSGDSNIGKTSVALNVANELANRNIPTMVFPIERGIRDVVKRFLQVRYNKTKNEVREIEEEEWDNKIIPDVINLPLYFSMPATEELETTIAQAKKYFGIKMVIVDHLDLMVRNNDSKNLNADTSRTVQIFKRLAQEHGIIFVLIHHIKKPENGSTIAKKPKKEDLKGTATLYQDPEAVIMLSAPDKELEHIEIDVVKNKGTMGSRIFEFNVSTGVMGKDVTEVIKLEKVSSLDDF